MVKPQGRLGSCETIVLVQLARDPVTQEIDRQAPFLLTNLQSGHTAIMKDEGVLAQIELGGSKAYFEAEWDGEQYTFGDRVPPPDRNNPPWLVPRLKADPR